MTTYTVPKRVDILKQKFSIRHNPQVTFQLSRDGLNIAVDGEIVRAWVLRVRRLLGQGNKVGCNS
jgi:hypothetical protein